LPAQCRADFVHDTVMYTTLSPCSMCAGAVGLFKLSLLVIGESVTFPGSKDILTLSGIPISISRTSVINMMKSWRSFQPTSACGKVISQLTRVSLPSGVSEAKCFG